MNKFLKRYKSFSPEDFEAQYNVRAQRPDYETHVAADWAARSRAAEAEISCELDVRYGQGERQTLNVFSCGNEGASTLIYFHGGYWQRGDKSLYSFLAAPFVNAGVNVVVVGYDLCPAVSITDIVSQAREAIAFVYRNLKLWGFDRERLSVMGHSAGGHLTQMMLGTDWPSYAEDLPEDLIYAGIPISPLSLLEPVRRTESLNAGLGMDEREAELQSPLLHHAPETHALILVVVGGAETAEFRWQAMAYVDEYGGGESRSGLLEVPGVDHFDVVNAVADVDNEAFEYVLRLVR